MATFPHHESLHLTNFTTFADAHFEFSPMVNVFVGENGTGKTHLMKVLYAMQYAFSRVEDGRVYLLKNVAEVFQVKYVRELRRQGTLTKSVVSGSFGGNNGLKFDIKVSARFGDVARQIKGEEYTPELVSSLPRPVFIPAIDMMGHTRRFLSTYDEYQIDFDQTHRDIVALLLSPERRQPTQNPETVELLSSLLGGTVEEESERFYLKTPQGRQPMPLVAEGLRKVATLQQLIRNGFLEPGSVLFWDEPEANVNPKLMDEIVDVLLRLARSGVQIFLSTHSYVILKEFDLQAREDDLVRYFALEASPDGTKVNATEDYTQLSPNPIAEQFDFVYDRELTRATGRPRQ